MAGLIRADDITTVKERASLEEVVGEHVTLRPAGPGSLKGLCPFHDEKTPSFYVRPAVGAYNCFGCDKGGDVISFVMEVEHLSFTETVERLAGRYGVELHYEEGQGPRPESIGRRTRLLEAHRVADEFYQEALVKHHDARTARDFLRARGFNGETCEPFGVGFAPRGGHELADVLQRKGFTEDEMVTSGLVGRGRGLYDRFRGRVVWPIRDITGDTIGFGARRIFDDDRIEAKYLNTSETPIYKKTHVLYGLDLAKKAISADRKAVIVEGYTDVMACHLSGVPHAVATCGTSFGADHVKALRRLIRDEAGQAPGRVIFTFDGDAAGQKAAMRAFELDRNWVADSYVAVARGGMDPCDLRQADGEPAVAALIDSAVPMYEFATDTVLKRFDLSTVEGRVHGSRAVAPVLKGIRDPQMRDAYTSSVAGKLGLVPDQLADLVRTAPELKDVEPRRREAVPEPDVQPTSTIPMPNFRDPLVIAEMQLLTCMLQFPAAVPGPQLMQLSADDFLAPAHRLVFEAVMSVGDPAARSLRAWSDAVREAVPEELAGYVARLSVDTLPTQLDRNTGLPQGRFAGSLILRVRDAAMRRRIDEVMVQLRQQSDEPEQARMLSARLLELQAAHARLAND